MNFMVRNKEKLFFHVAFNIYSRVNTNYETPHWKFVKMPRKPVEPENLINLTDNLGGFKP